MEVYNKLDIKSYIPSAQKKYLSNDPGSITYRLTSSKLQFSNTYSVQQSVEYTQGKFMKVLDTVGALLLAFLCLGFVFGNFLIPDLIEDFYIAGPILAIVGFVFLGSAIVKWTGDEAIRKLYIDNQGLKLSGWRAVKWEDIKDIFIKEFSGSDVGMINSYLIIIAENKILSLDLSGLKSNKPNQIVLMRSDITDIKEDLTYFWSVHKNKE
ncbi:hypothetical protein GGR28_003742 [Lewinella aquimaris]|uniref:Uncharacterized protein n=1 Tax=Neolewinella aquimaris TaxID=1835722 RepID=A0A840EC60_9BACT|nr:hypothetical protein [Neolewinella aquimaris]MBB4081095.1 hypothetical protein [Neolewinella aquimaris]